MSASSCQPGSQPGSWKKTSNRSFFVHLNYYKVIFLLLRNFGVVAYWCIQTKQQFSSKRPRSEERRIRGWFLVASKILRIFGFKYETSVRRYVLTSFIVSYTNNFKCWEIKVFKSVKSASLSIVCMTKKWMFVSKFTISTLIPLVSY